MMVVVDIDGYRGFTLCKQLVISRRRMTAGGTPLYMYL